MARGMIYSSVLPSLARTATANGPDMYNDSWSGIHVVLNVTAASGTGGLQVVIQGKDTISGAYYPINPTPSAVITTGTFAYEVWPYGANTPTAAVVQRTSGLVPYQFRILVIHGDASSYTYSVSASMV